MAGAKRLFATSRRAGNAWPATAQITLRGIRWALTGAGIAASWSMFARFRYSSRLSHDTPTIATSPVDQDHAPPGSAGDRRPPVLSDFASFFYLRPSVGSRWKKLGRIPTAASRAVRRFFVDLWVPCVNASLSRPRTAGNVVNAMLLVEAPPSARRGTLLRPAGRDLVIGDVRVHECRTDRLDHIAAVVRFPE